MRQIALVTFVVLAGLGSVARGEDSPSHDELLKQKLAQLEKLNAEIASLRGDSGKAQQIQIQVQIVDFSHERLCVGIRLFIGHHKIERIEPIRGRIHFEDSPAQRVARHT